MRSTQGAGKRCMYNINKSALTDFAMTENHILD